MDSETKTLLSIVVMAAHMADALRGWVNEQTEFMEVDGRSPEYGILVKEEASIYGIDMSSASAPLPPDDLVRIKRWAYILTGTWIDGVYQMTIGFAPRANKVLYHIEPKRRGFSLPGARPWLHITKVDRFQLL